MKRVELHTIQKTRLSVHTHLYEYLWSWKLQAHCRRAPPGAAHAQRLPHPRPLRRSLLLSAHLSSAGSGPVSAVPSLCARRLWCVRRAEPGEAGPSSGGEMELKPGPTWTLWSRRSAGARWWRTGTVAGAEPWGAGGCGEGGWEWGPALRGFRVAWGEREPPTSQERPPWFPP